MIPWWQSFLYASLGAFILYCYLASRGRTSIRFISSILPFWGSRWTGPIEALVFVAVGGAVAQATMTPCKPAQAIFFGFAWTGFLIRR